MKVSIYDYANREIEVNLPVDKIEDIASIYVTIISGDEIVAFSFKNGKGLTVDSSDCRCMDFYDGSYVVIGSDKIKKWIEFEFKGTNEDTVSYARQEAFYLDEDEEEEEEDFADSINMFLQNP